MRVVHRTQKGFLLEITAGFDDRTFRDQLLVKLVPVLEAPGRHPTRRSHGVGGGIGEWNVERPEFAAEKTGGGEGLEFLRLAVVKALADVDERGHRGIERPERARDHRAK